MVEMSEEKTKGRDVMPKIKPFVLTFTSKVGPAEQNLFCRANFWRKRDHEGLNFMHYTAALRLFFIDTSTIVEEFNKAVPVCAGERLDKAKREDL